MKIKYLAALVAVVAASMGYALWQRGPVPVERASPEIEDAIKRRQAGYTVLAWNVSNLDSNLKGEFKQDEVIRAANAIAAIANSGLHNELYPVGSDKGTGFHISKVNALYWKDSAKVADLAQTFATSASELATLAATGDKAAIGVQLAKVQESCKSCHESYRKH